MTERVVDMKPEQIRESRSCRAKAGTMQREPSRAIRPLTVGPGRATCSAGIVPIMKKHLICLFLLAHLVLATDPVVDLASGPERNPGPDH